MRKITLTRHIPLVVDNPTSTTNLGSSAFFVVPYKRVTDSHNTDLDERVAIVYGGVVGILKTDKTGVYASGTGISFTTLDNVRLGKNVNPASIVNDYLHLLSFAECKEDLSVGLVDYADIPSYCWYPLDSVLELAVRAYKDEFVKENEDQLKKLREQAIPLAAAQFRLRFGKKRPGDMSTTTYYGSDKNVLAHAGMMSHGTGYAGRFVDLPMPNKS